MDSLSTLRLLASTITDAVNTMERAYTHSGMSPPSLNEPFNPKDPAEAIRQEPAVSAAVMNLIAAASQITATVCDPVVSALNSSHAFHISSCLRVASEFNVVEILREAGPGGLHVKQIAAQITVPGNIDPELLARVLRLLATHNIFREVSPGAFANNRISSTLDKGKSPASLFEDRAGRLAGTSGIAALAEFFSEDCMKSSAYLTDTMMEPKENIVPYNRAFGTDEPMFHWVHRPENLYKLTRFAAGMHGTAATEPPDTIFQGFDWSRLPAGGVIVDSLKVVNQDLGHTVEGAKIHWKENFPEHVTKQMVEFQTHDFFTPQPVKDAAVFLLRYIVHDWSDARTVQILKHLRDAATPSTKLVIIEKILPAASSGEGSKALEIPGAARPSAPAPLLPNWGIATAELYYYDMTVHNMLGGGERTLEGYVDVFARSGWNLVEVHHCGRSQLSHIVGRPM
ncbi:O-methyltransferase [Mycena sp. CBHHK59/15]|nr:O-methyltransferase [Mycena sp. CBHHK59/15]